MQGTLRATVPLILVKLRKFFVPDRRAQVAGLNYATAVAVATTL